MRVEVQTRGEGGDGENVHHLVQVILHQRTITLTYSYMKKCRLIILGLGYKVGENRLVFTFTVLNLTLKLEYHFLCHTRKGERVSNGVLATMP